MHLWFDSLNTWVGMTISLFLFSRLKKFFFSKCCHSKIVLFRISLTMYTLTRVPGGDDLVWGEDNVRKWNKRINSLSLSLGRLLCSAPSSSALVLHMGLVLVEKNRLPWCRASESAVSDVPSYKRYAARQSDTIMWSHWGHQYVEDLTH
jgi:hypothetical protein